MAQKAGRPSLPPPPSPPRSPPRRQERDVEGVPVEVGVLRVEGEVAPPAGGLQPVQIFPVVDGKDNRVFRILRRHRDHPFDQADLPEMICDGDEPLRRLRVFERRGVQEVVGVVDPGTRFMRAPYAPRQYISFGLPERRDLRRRLARRFRGAASGFPKAMIASNSSGCRTESADSSSCFAISGPVIQQVPYPSAQAARRNWAIPAEIP